MAYFYLSIAYADLQAGLGMDRRAVDHAPILQCKSGVVIGTLNTVTHQSPFGKRSTEVGARFGYGKEPISPTNQQNRDAIVERSSRYRTLATAPAP